MWERFCYYGMRVLLTLFLVKSLPVGDADAALIYGAYTALIYAAPVLGGKMADQYLGYRYAILLGAVMMAIGEFLMVGGALGGPEAIAISEMLMLFGMGALIVGNGFFKANISTIVGKLYEDNDPRRDSGFTIYIGINMAHFLPQLSWPLSEKPTALSTASAWHSRHVGRTLHLLRTRQLCNFSASTSLKKATAGLKITSGFLWAHSPSSCVLLLDQPKRLDDLLAHGLVCACRSLTDPRGHQRRPMWRDRMIALVIHGDQHCVLRASSRLAPPSPSLQTAM